MPPGTSAARADRAQRRAAIGDRLLIAAEKLLAAGEPYAAISVERISREAQLTRTTFYVYFEDKADLLHAWLETIDAEIESATVGWWEIDAGVDREQLRAVLGRILSTYSPHAHLMSAVYDAALFDRALDIGLQEVVRRTANGLQQHIERGQRHGWIDSGLLPAETAAWLAWMIQRGQLRLRSADEAELERELDAYTAIVWRTLYSPAAG